MQIRLREFAFAAALTVGASAVGAMPAMAQQDESQRYPHRSSTEAQRTDPDTYANHPDYSNNEYYRTGNDEGYQDYQAKKQREKHEHQYRNDDDRNAHDYGYQEGWSGRSYRDHNTRSGQTNANGSGESRKYRSGDTSGQTQSRDRDDQYRNSDSHYRDSNKPKLDNDDHVRDNH